MSTAGVHVRDEKGEVLTKVRIGDTKVQALQRLGCCQSSNCVVLNDKDGFGLLDDDLISAEGAPYVIKSVIPCTMTTTTTTTPSAAALATTEARTAAPAGDEIVAEEPSTPRRSIRKTTVKQETPKAIKKETTIKKETPKAIKKETPKAIKQETPKAIKQETPKPIKQETPKTIKEETTPKKETVTKPKAAIKATTTKKTAKQKTAPKSTKKKTTPEKKAAAPKQLIPPKGWTGRRVVPQFTKNHSPNSQFSESATQKYKTKHQHTIQLTNVLWPFVEAASRTPHVRGAPLTKKQRAQPDRYPPWTNEEQDEWNQIDILAHEQLIKEFAFVMERDWDWPDVTVDPPHLVQICLKHRREMSVDPTKGFDCWAYWQKYKLCYKWLHNKARNNYGGGVQDGLKRLFNEGKIDETCELEDLIESGRSKFSNGKFQLVLDYLVKGAVGSEVFKKKRKTRLVSDILTVAEEALILVNAVNGFEKYKVHCLKLKPLKDCPDALYTDPSVRKGRSKSDSWSDAGVEEYDRLFDLVNKDRRCARAAAVEATYRDEWAAEADTGNKRKKASAPSQRKRGRNHFSDESLDWAAWSAEVSL